MSASKPVRTRFAPSPTGSLHIGGLRTALFNWLYARHSGGQFVLRIEDTDQKRYDPNALRILMESLTWAGLDWDEGPDKDGAYGPYVQSERLALYQEWANWLVAHEHAYRSYETPAELEAMRKDREAKGLPPGYDRGHRDLSPVQIAAYEAEGRTSVVRLKMPLAGEMHLPDALRGTVTFDVSQLQDTVLLKSDGFPTYHLAHVIDDHFMEISHVMRAVEWLPSYPIHAQLWQAFGWEAPIYVHLPVMLNPNGKGKMSKRNPPRDAHGRIIPVLVHDYIAAGYLPDAVDNFLANIGWNFGDDREVFSMAEAIERFDLTRINEANSAFPPDKLDWLNGVYLREMPSDELAVKLRAPIEREGWTASDDLLRQIAPLVQPRIKTLNDVVEMAGFFFREPFQPAPLEAFAVKGQTLAQVHALLTQVLAALDTVTDWAHGPLEDTMRSLSDHLGLKPKDVFGPLRAAITGQAVSTPLFESMAIIGREICLARIADAVARLAETQSS
ncbi:MAG: glutamate--tRNA ligase [Anaerolineae bacterium]